MSPADRASAANAADFDPGNIMSDAVFYNSGSMNVSQVQAFLNARVPACRAGYTCLKDYREQTPSRAVAAGLCAAYPGASESAAQIVTKVGAACGINPQVLIVLLEKEQSLVTDTWPTAGQYRSATGYGCPDTSGCDAQYYGFFNQVYNAAKQFKRYRATPTSWAYQAGRTNTILWSPNRSCGTSQVYIQNQATAGLYIYTPYRPNQAALNNLYGTGDACSTYGNRNFWRIFTDWFGSTTTPPIASTPVPSSPVFGVGDFSGDGKPDLMARKPDGTLWLYAGTGVVDSAHPGYSPPVQIGIGWNGFDMVFGAGDTNGDGATDIVARTPAGALWLYPGNGRGGFLTPAQIGNGWNIFETVFASGDFDGDAKADLIGRKSDGTLWLYAGNGNGGFRSITQIGNGWKIFDRIFSPGDFNGDATADLIARKPDGSLWLYAGDGTGRFQTITQIGIDWNHFGSILGGGDLTGDRVADVIARATDGTLTLYPGNGKGGFLSPVPMGNGNGLFTDVAGVRDFNGDGKPDLITRKANGTLWLYAGTGKVDGSTAGYSTPKQIGNGWNNFDSIFGPGDFNGDRNADIVGKKSDGSLWLYPGSGTGSFLAPAQIGNGWNIFNAILSTGDFNGDGKADIIGRKPNGSLWLYAGNGTGGFQAVDQIGNGWNIFNTILSTGDFNGDSKTDIIGRKQDGTLWLYPGNGVGGFLAPRQAGTTG